MGYTSFLDTFRTAFNPKQAGLFADWYGQGVLPFLCNFCLNDPIDLKLGKYIAFGKISRY